ncbi:MAG: phosphoadenosine phosphosulfate reductase family protein, partial [Deltaproteobacteria bacterium]
GRPMRTTIQIIHQALEQSKKPAIAFSGGSDSMVLLDLIYSRTTARPPVIFADSQMEYETTIPFVEAVCQQYGAALHIARAPRTPLEQWQKSGWAMLGKLAARKWMQTHPGYGFKVDVSSCCRNMKIAPARKAMKALGVDLHFTGQRGQVDDALRGLRALKDGAISYIKADKLHIANPLIGWTDSMVRRYTLQNALQVHPAKSQGAKTIGCLYCGGGSRHTNSGFPILRRALPDAWKRFIFEWKAGEIILAIKHDKPLAQIRRAVEKLGGLEYLAASRPWIFDFLRETPLEGYQK